MSSPGGEVNGHVAAGFERVADEFGRTLDEGRGAAFAAFAGGEPVVDLWGGLADGEAGAPWHEDTTQLVFSGTKGLVAVCLLLLLERGALDLEAPVARYWPELAAPGVLVRHVVSHTAGLPGLRRGFGAADLLDRRRLALELAAEPPFWPPGARLAYHAFTYGVLCDELVRGVDGRSVGRFFAEEVAGPLSLELWIGLPAVLEPRVARLHRAESYGPTSLGDEPDPLLEAIYGGLLGDEFPWNEPAFHEAEIPAANAIGTARSIARLYSSLVDGGDLLSPETLALGRRELSRGTCAITGRPYAFGVGFELQTDLRTLGPPPSAFGHTGSGGSSHGAWPDKRVGFSYAMNELRSEAEDDRARRLLAALHEAVA
ncbi:MAG TPA: serine hydrolase domain-containing protein [Gaiellaceae bacterium]|nr:serine hydrolase domain-containing protein [Gaiellaceae bacterium]